MFFSFKRKNGGVLARFFMNKNSFSASDFLLIAFFMDYFVRVLVMSE